MKLRTAYFCKECDEEIDIAHDNHEGMFTCPHCNNHNHWGLTAVYEWKVQEVYKVSQYEIDKANEVLDALACKKMLEEKFNL